MNEVYNLRIGDMLFNNKSYHQHSEVDANIVAIIYKMTPKYVYYAVCARNNGDPDGAHYVTMDNKSKKSKLYESIKSGRVSISYANGISRRRKITNFSD